MTAHIPACGDAVAQWLEAKRDEQADQYGPLPAWYALDALLDDYRRHADTWTPLNQHLPEPADPNPF